LPGSETYPARRQCARCSEQVCTTGHTEPAHHAVALMILRCYWAWSCAGCGSGPSWSWIQIKSRAS